jgi:outer membrane biosynthesis protein TonB
MIPRTLVPMNVRRLSPEEAKKPARRLTSYLDDRTVVPHELSDAPPLDGRTSIPAHFPLDVLASRTLVPRDMPAKKIERRERDSEYVSRVALDSRMVVPVHVATLAPEEEREPEQPLEMTPELREVVEPDVFMTGDANLLIEPAQKHDPKGDLITRVASIVVHVGLVIFVIFAPKIFPAHTPTREEMDLARRQLPFVYLPPDAEELSRRPPVPPRPKIRINPETLNTVAPPRPETHALVAPPVNSERPPRDLPEAPTPRVPVTPQPVQPATPAPSRLEPIQPASPSPNRLNLQLPQSSPGRALQDQIQDAIRKGGGGTYSSGGIAPGGGGGGRGGPSVGNNVTILTPTEGVDFTSYINRLLALVRRNWYAIMPESAMMGDKGIVVLTFHINRDGSVPMPGEPVLERTSGKPPLDSAAMSSIRTSSPFEPLPQQFKGPYIELRFIYFYNLRPGDTQ